MSEKLKKIIVTILIVIAVITPIALNIYIIATYGGKTASEVPAWTYYVRVWGRP